MKTLHQNGTWLQFNKCNIHREASIGWFKYLITTATLQHHAKLRIDNYLRNVKFEADEIITLTIIDTSHNHYGQSSNNGKQKQTNHDDDQSEWKEIALPPFDLSAKVISFGNDDTRISTVIYAVTCHLDNAKSIKTLLSRASKTSLYTNPNDSAHFVLYELIQYT